MKYLYALFIFLLALFLAAFIQQNSAGIALRYFSWSTPELPISLYMILSFAAGYVLAVIVGFGSGMRNRIRASAARLELKKVRSELERVKGDTPTDQAEPDEKTATGATDAGPKEPTVRFRRPGADHSGLEAGPGDETVTYGGGEKKEK